MRHGLIILALLAVTNICAKADEKFYVVVAQAEFKSNETIKVLNDLTAPVDSEMGPMSMIACNYQAGPRAQAWIASTLPKWKLMRWWCVDVDELDSFLEKMRSYRT